MVGGAIYVFIAKTQDCSQLAMFARLALMIF